MALGNFACGANSASIGNIPASVYRCDHGSPSSWTSTFPRLILRLLFHFQWCSQQRGSLDNLWGVSAAGLCYSCHKCCCLWEWHLLMDWSRYHRHWSCHWWDLWLLLVILDGWCMAPFTEMLSSKSWKISCEKTAKLDVTIGAMLYSILTSMICSVACRHIFRSFLEVISALLLFG